MIAAQTKLYKTSLRLTKTASEKMRGFGISERSFFMADKPFQVFIERYPQSADGSLSVALFFGLEETAKLTDKAHGQLIVLHCVFANHQLLVTNVTLRKAYQALGTNWQREESIVFNNSRDPVPVAFINMINRMTPAKERSDYVKKRISSWEGYLKIQEQGMDIPDIKTGYSNLAFSHDFSRITLTGCRMNDNDWKSLRNLSVRLTGIDGDVGTVMKTKNRTVEIELNNYIIKQLREKGHALSKKEVVFSNFAALSQIRRLRQGFTNLEKGLAVNPQLDRLLFEEQPNVAPLKELEKLSFHNRLNEFQQQAVTGAMSAEDLYVIQGPPGTGKTTVISEICLQNAKKGLRTLVASQSNLAVDNALGRLLAHKDIRILRVGRTESIEEDGKKFIEENVGQYWKDNTLKEIAAQYEKRKIREAQVDKELEATEQAYAELQPVFENLKKTVEDKKAAQQKHGELQSSIEQQRNQMRTAELEKEQATRGKQDTAEKIETLQASIDKMLALLDSGKDVDWFESQQKRIAETIQQLERARQLKQLEEQMASLRRDMELIEEKRDGVMALATGKKAMLDTVDSMKKVDSLMQVMTEQNIQEVPAITFSISKLDMIRDKMTERKKLEDYNKSVTAAIGYVEKLLAPSGIKLEEVKERALSQGESFTSADIDQFLEKLRALLKSSQQIDSSVLAKALTGLYKRQNDVWRRGAMLKSSEVYIEESKRAFGQLKKALSGELEKQHQHYLALDEKGLEQLERKRQDLNRFNQQAKQLSVAIDIPADIEQAIVAWRAEQSELGQDKVAFDQAAQRLEQQQAKRTEEMNALNIIEARIAETDSEMAQVQERLSGKELELESLKEILSSNPETEYAETAKKLASLSFDKESLKQEQKNFPLLQSVQKKWLELLESANDHDLDEIRKLYIKHANVIGTTCVASARKDFQDNYPVFDVVIIDEVSKATPPELLLPMLKGKKVILVGDHHQLPPLLGNDTLEETLEEMIKENSGFEEKRELEKLLEESLFERLYKNLPETNKTMLAIQYRMHEDIMETISPFYKHENVQLQCGLLDSDKERDHFLESTSVKRSNHLMWLDLPNEPAYFEERMSGGKSLYNAAELTEISRLLVELNDAVGEAKAAGRIDADELKTVGVISFYGEQVKRLQRMIDQELRLPHLLIRTGTVDRFQGSEMEIILLSMVRNNKNERGDIGFAKDYRRLNVALSRAKQLLVMIGSSDMFTKRAKKDETKRMYQHVLDVAEQKNGVKVLQRG
ncbi:AAA domain-containing protein [Planococcus sp. ISL-109]|uniref:AAA domain-containing protein n=1 Tax=Planococcus sp. ISL-109 TaxID=2819166 RepID=UPI001BE8E694|nr:AAA domain-containing protein [Planococcus sp. ISL-109]MBT2583478.1 AAA family ATPase [Planococcus sp. ISL-109]